MPWGPSQSSRLRPVVMELPSEECGGSSSLLSMRSFSTKGAMKLTLPVPVLGLCSVWLFPAPPAKWPREPGVSFAPILPLGSRKARLTRSFGVLRKSSLLAGWHFQSLFSLHAVSLEDKEMIPVDFKGHWMCSWKIRYCWCNSSVTPEDLLGQVLQEWSKKM